MYPHLGSGLMCFFYLASHFGFNLAFSSFHSFFRYSAYSASFNFVMMFKFPNFRARRPIARNQKVQLKASSATIAFVVTSPSSLTESLPVAAAGEANGLQSVGADRRVFWRAEGAAFSRIGRKFVDDLSSALTRGETI